MFSVQKLSLGLTKFGLTHVRRWGDTLACRFLFLFLNFARRRDRRKEEEGTIHIIKGGRVFFFPVHLTRQLTDARGCYMHYYCMFVPARDFFPVDF